MISFFLAALVLLDDALPRTLAVEDAPGVAVTADSEPSMFSREAGLSVRFQDRSDPFVIDVGLHGRLSLPIGRLQDSENIIITGPGGTLVIWEDHLRYADLFDPGLGLALEGALVFIEPRNRSSYPGRVAPSFGIYAAIHEDEFNGDSATDINGNKLSAKDMRLFSGFVGIKAAQSMGSDYFADVRIGGGLVRYDEVKGKYTTASGLPFNATLIEESTNYAFELRGHGGMRFGPVAFVAGMGFRVFGQPDSDTSVGEAGLSPKTLFTLDFDIGVEIGF